MNETALKEELGFLKTWTTILSATVAGVFSWIVAHYSGADSMEIIVASIMLTVFVVILVRITVRAKKIIRELGRLS